MHNNKRKDANIEAEVVKVNKHKIYDGNANSIKQDERR